MQKLPKSKRFKFAIYVFHIFILIGFYAINKNVDLTSLSVYMTATAIPLIFYILGDTFRKSE